MVGLELRKRSVEEYRQPTRAIQFTEWMETQKECASWYKWFKDRGVSAAVIMLDNAKGTRYAVYRNWLGNPKMDVDCIFNLSVLDACNNFL